MHFESDRAYLQIGQVAERTELSLKTIRHYDEVGLVEPSARTAGGFRLYTDTDVERLMVIRRMKPLGFTLAEMKQLLEALGVLDDPTATLARRDAAATFLLQCRDTAGESAQRLRRQLGQHRGADMSITGNALGMGSTLRAALTYVEKVSRLGTVSSSIYVSQVEVRSCPVFSSPSMSTTSRRPWRSIRPCSTPSRPSASPATRTSPSPSRRSSSC